VFFFFAIFLFHVSCLSFETDVGPSVAYVCDHMEDDFTGRSYSTCRRGETCMKAGILKKRKPKIKGPRERPKSRLWDITEVAVNPLNAELNPICHLLALLGVHHFLHVSRIRVKSLTLRLLMSYIYIYIYIYMEHLFLM